MFVCWSLVSSHSPTQDRRSPHSLSAHRWSLIWPDPVHRRKGRMCSIGAVAGCEAGNPLPARPDLWYPPFSLTKLRRGRAFAPCSLP